MRPRRQAALTQSLITMRFAASRSKIATPGGNNHTAIPMRSAITDSRNAENYARRNNHLLQNTEAEPIDLETIETATAAHTRYLSSPAGVTFQGKTQGFVLQLPPQHKPHATFMRPSQCILQHSIHHHFPSSPLPLVTTSLRHHFP